MRRMDEAEAVGTAAISRAEVAAALAKAARMGILTRGDAESAREASVSKGRISSGSRISIISLG